MEREERRVQGLDYRPSCKCHVTQKLRNSVKNPFGAKICINSSFQLLLYIIKAKSQEDQYFSDLNSSEVMSQTPWLLILSHFP